MTIRNPKSTLRGLTGCPRRLASSISAARRPISVRGTRTVVKGGIASAAILLIHPSLTLSLVGLGLAAALVAFHGYQCRRGARPVPPGAVD